MTNLDETKRRALRELQALQWTERAGRFSFAGMLGGYRRVILGEDLTELAKLAAEMAQGRA